MKNAKVIAMSFNTCNLKFSLIVEIDGLIVHTQLCESQANQVKGHLGLGEGSMGKVADYHTGADKNSHIVYWNISEN
jgi:hypothetical protein